MSDADNTATNKDADYHKARHKKGFVSGFVDSVNPGYAVAGVAALWTAAVSSTDKGLNEILRGNGRMEAIDNAVKDAYHWVYPQDKWKPTEAELAELNRLKLTERENPGGIAAWREEVKNTRLQGEKITNYWRKFQRLRPYQQQQIVATFVTVAAIGLGALYSYSKSHAQTEELHRLRAENEQSQR